MRRTLAILLCLLLSSGCMAETYLINYTLNGEDSYYSHPLLLQDDGTVLADNGDYAEIYEITDSDVPEEERLFCVMSTERVVEDEWDRIALQAMMDAKGNLLTGFEYSYIYGDSEINRIRYGKPGGISGILDESGAEVLEGAYDALLPLSGGRWLAFAHDPGDHPRPLLRIEADGSVTETALRGTFASLPLTEGDPIVVYTGNDSYTCVDENLEPCFAESYATIEPFRGGRAIAVPRGNTLYGILDAKETFLLPPEYASVSFFGEGDRANVLAAAADGLSFQVLDGEDFSPLWDVDLHEYPNVSDSSIIANEDGTVSAWLYDANYNARTLTFSPDGKQMAESEGQDDILAEYPRAYGAPERRVLVEEEDVRCHLIDLAGERRSEDFQSLQPMLWKDGHGRYLSAVYRTTTDADGDRSVVWNTYRMGVVDEDGRELLPARYESIQVLDLDRYWVKLGSRTGMIDGAGHWYYAVDDYDFLMD